MVDRARVGVRELRQNLSVYLDRVKAGESLEVTEHGRPVAQLRPISARPRSRLDDLIEEGAARRIPGDLLAVTPVALPAGRSALEALLEARDEERG